MKKNKILLTLLASSCIGMVAGCGDDHYKIIAKVSNSEYGYIKGGGNYAVGSKATLKIYPTEGCTPNDMLLLRSGSTDSVSAGVPNAVYGDNGITKYYEFIIDPVTPGAEGNVGAYTASFTCLQQEKPSGDATTAERQVVYKIVKEDGTFDETSVAKQTVKFGTKLKKVDYVEGYEGKITWYKEYNGATTVFSEDWDFNNPLEMDLVLFGKVSKPDASDIVSEAITNFTSSTKIKMNIKNYAVTLKDYEKSMEFTFRDNSENNQLSSYVIQNNTYYESYNGEYYSMKFEGSGFTKENILSYSMFFKHIGIDTKGYSFSRFLDNNNNHVIEEINVGKDKSNKDVKINCYKYKAVDGENNTIMTFWIKNGYLYKTEDAEGIVNVINYPEEEITSMTFENVKPMYLVRLTSNDADLNDILSVNNAKFETILKIRPSNGETLEKLLKTENGKLIINESEIANLKPYDYEFVQVEDGQIYDLDLKELVASHTNVQVQVNSKYSNVKEALEKLVVGGYRIKTSMLGFDDEVISKYFVVPTDMNILDIDDANKPDGMTNVLLSTIETVNLLEDDDLGYHHFKYNSSTGVYSFYEQEYANYPYLSIKIDKTEKKILNIVYYEGIDSLDIRTFTSEFDYSYGSYIASLEALNGIGYTIANAGVNYPVYKEENLLEDMKTAKPDSMNETMFNDVKLLSEFLYEDYTLEVNEKVYIFTNVDDTNKVYTITLGDNGEIVSYKVGTASIYSFHYGDEKNVVMSHLDNMKTRLYSFSTNENDEIYDFGYNWLNTADADCVNLKRLVEGLSGFEYSFANGKHTYVKIDGDFIHTYEVELLKQNMLKISYSDRFNSAVYFVKFSAYEELKVSLGLAEDIGFTYETNSGNVYLTHALDLTSKPVDFADNEWSALVAFMELVANIGGNVNLPNNQFDYSYNRVNNVHVITRKIDGQKFALTLNYSKLAGDRDKLLITKVVYYNTTINSIELNLGHEDVENIWTYIDAIQTAQGTFENVDDSTKTFTIDDNYLSLDQHYIDIINGLYDLLGEHGLIDSSYTLIVDSVAESVTLEKEDAGVSYKYVLRKDNEDIYLDYFVDAVKETYKKIA